MKCQICNTNSANIIFTQIINNEKIVMQICSECAKKKGLTLDIRTETPAHVEPVDSLVGSLTGDLDSDSDSAKIPDITCPECNLTFEEFKKTGLFGCDMCHKAFGSHISNLLKQIHGLARHEGKSPRIIPEEIDVKKKLKELRSKLKRFIELEEYENAAEIRDRISMLEKERQLRQSDSTTSRNHDI